MKKKSTMTFMKAQTNLTIIWLAISGFILAILIILTIRGKYEGIEETVWKWAGKFILPTLTIIIGVYLGEMQKKTERRMIEKVFYKIVFWLSAFYLAIIALIIFLLPGTNYEETLNESELYLVLLQGLVGLAMGFFFVKSQTATEE